MLSGGKVSKGMSLSVKCSFMGMLVDYTKVWVVEATVDAFLQVLPPRGKKSRLHKPTFRTTAIR
jgi:hypothetical protein